MTSPDRPESEWTYRILLRDLPDALSLSLAVDLIPDLDGTSAQERKAYMEAVQEQGAMPEPTNRQQRRMQKRLQQGRGPTPQMRRGGNKKQR